MRIVLKRIVTDIESIFSSAEGSISSARVLMFLLAIFGMYELHSIIRHMNELKDTATLALWMGGLPTIIGMFIALMAAPYTISKSAGTVSDLVSLIQSRRNNQ